MSEARSIVGSQPPNTEDLVRDLRSDAIGTLMKLWDIQTNEDPPPKTPLWRHFDAHGRISSMVPDVVVALLITRIAYKTHVVYLCGLCGECLHYFEREPACLSCLNDPCRCPCPDCLTIPCRCREKRHPAGNGCVR